MAKRKIIKNYEGKRKGEQGTIFKYTGKTKTTYGYILELPASPGKRNKREKGGFATEFDAVLAKRKLEKTAFVTSNSDFNILTISEFFDKYFYNYLENIENLAVSTLKGYRRDIAQIIEIIGDKKLIDIQKKDRTYTANYLLDLDFSTHVINTKLDRLKKLIDYAIELDYLNINNFKGKSIKAKEKLYSSVDVYSNADIENIYSEINKVKDPQKYLIPISIALYTGCRAGEIIALKWSDVDFEERIININKSMKLDMDNNFVLGTTKTKKNRIVPIPLPLFEILKRHRLYQKENKLKLGREYIDSDFVCTYVNGRLVTNTTIGCLNRLMKNKGIEFYMHKFRHTFATNAVAAGVNVKVLQEILGHTKIETTMKYYVNVDNAQKLDAAEIIAATFST